MQPALAWWRPFIYRPSDCYHYIISIEYQFISSLSFVVNLNEIRRLDLSNKLLFTMRMASVIIGLLLAGG